MTERGCAEYFDLPTYADKQDFLAVLSAAERAGAIRCEHHQHRRYRSAEITRIRLVSDQKLADHLRVKPHWDALSDALHKLEPWAARCPPEADEIRRCWESGRKYHRRGIEDLQDVIDALRVIELLRQHPGEDLVIRVASVALFSDSKRIEAISGLLLAMLRGTEEAEEGETLQAYGLVKHPQPMWLAGHASIRTADGSRTALPAPYLCLAPDAVQGVEPGRDGKLPDYVLTVENLTTFNLAARKAACRGLVLYAPGYPSPAWRGAYERLLASTPPGLPVWHWGDVDRGGLGVAALLHRTAATANRVLRPWLMDPMDPRVGGGRVKAAQDSIRIVAEKARALGWEEVARGVEQGRHFLEQEQLDIFLP